MEIARLVTMANQIAGYFGAEPNKTESVASTAAHLTRFWDPRMRRQIIAHYDARGEGFSDIARAAVGLLAERSREMTPTE